MEEKSEAFGTIAFETEQGEARTVDVESNAAVESVDFVNETEVTDFLTTGFFTVGLESRDIGLVVGCRGTWSC